jgi:hypothetical protein
MIHHTQLRFAVVLAVSLPVLVATASEGKHEPMMKMDEHQSAPVPERELNTLEDLKAEVEALRKAVAVLQATQPTGTTLMPDFAERFHVMHRAGDVGDWAVASHELLEMQRIAKVIGVIDPQKGALMKGFMTQSFAKLNAAMEHGNRQAFDKALTETVTNCNACHTAVGSVFIKITLNVDQSLSMRHPHQLTKSEKPGEHMHTH